MPAPVSAFPGGFDNFNAEFDPAIGLAVNALERASTPSILVATATGVAATDTIAINAAITAANASSFAKGIRFQGTTTYLSNGGHNVGGGSPGALTISFDSWNTTVKLANGANTDLFTCNGTYTRGLVFNGCHFDGNGNNQTTASNIINGYGAVWCTFTNNWFENPFAAATLNTSSSAAIRLFQNGTAGFGQGNIIANNLFWNSNGNTYLNQVAVLTYQSDENIIVNNRFQGFGTSSNTYPSCVFDQSGLNDISHNSFVVGTGIYCGGSGSRSRIIGNIMDGCTATNGQIYAGSTGVKIKENHCYNIPAGADGIYVDNADHIEVIGNTCETANNTAAQSGIHLGGTPTSCLIEGNTMSVQGSGSYTATGGIKIDSPTALTGTVIRNNIGFNPSTPTTPAFPLTTVTYTNSTGLDVWAVVTNGTGAMTTVVNGKTGPNIALSTQGLIPIPANGTFTPTYASGAPAWQFLAVN